MRRHTRRRLLTAVGRAAAGIGLASGVAGASQTDESAGGSADDPAESTASIRFVAAAPESGEVDVIVDGETLIGGLEYASVSPFRTLAPGGHRVRIRDATDGEAGEAGDETGEAGEATLFETRLNLRPGRHTAVAIPTRGRGRYPIWLKRYSDRPAEIGDDEALVRLVHASPDAPAADVTVAGSGRLLFDDLAYGETQQAVVPAGDKTLQIRPATGFDIGPVVRTVDVSIRGGRRYAVFATGYLTPFDEPTDAPVRVFYTASAL